MESDLLPLEDPIKILLDMASDGTIDPWNIDIVKVTDEFLSHLGEMKMLNLRVSGRTLLYGSILLRMKSEVLLEEDNESTLCEEEFYEEDFFTDKREVEIGKKAEDKFFHHVKLKKRPVTLLELIDQLDKAIKLREKKNRSKTHKKDEREDERRERKVLEMLDEDDIETIIRQMREILDESFKSKATVTLSELMGEGKDNPASIILTYLPLLFLSARKYIVLKQKDPFEEIYIEQK
ncbi:MAG: segregation/condensation protein A [Candidatus Methanolliviera hydrocarbonicum]|uniref:Segregation/condensation protein A n=1 Tax=Candidatus Methanolliviera hydrocarbonicum TaxID=2491085 RepID=A0A520KYC2_9EURY|nr:MAG: segregation/condensation protein A [Candidatus Methanolliviera hydrocarbonicum]